MESLKGYRICFLAGTLGVGGAEKQLYYILRALMKLGAEVHLVCNYSGEYWEEPVKALGVHYKSLEGKGSSLHRLREITRYVRKVKPHVIQSQHFYMSLYAAVAARFCGAISVGATRSSLLAEMNNTSGRFRKYCFHWPRHFVMNSLEAMEEARAIEKDHSRLHYLPNAIETEKFFSINRTRKGPDEAVTLVTIGRAAPQKRFERFINLIGELYKKGIPVKGVMVGYGPLIEELKEQARRLGLDENIMAFPGKTSTPEVFLAQADVFVLTSDHEGTPNVILEAMASGLPVLSTRVGNIPYFIEEGEHGFLVDKENATELLEKALILITDADMRHYMGAQGRTEIATKFSVEALENNLLDLYSKILQPEKMKVEETGA